MFPHLKILNTQDSKQKNIAEKNVFYFHQKQKIKKIETESNDY